MNATNRALNRGLLLVVGVLLAAAGAALILVSSGPVRFSQMRRAAVEWAETAARPTIALTGDAAVPVAGVVAAGVALVLVVALVVFVATRGGGRTSTVVRDEGGRTSVDRSVADAVLAGALRERVDVLSVRTTSCEVKGSPTVALRVRARRGADLPCIVRAAECAVAEWDALAGSEVPIILHLVDRKWSDGWRSATRLRELTERPRIEDVGAHPRLRSGVPNPGRDIERERTL